MLTQIYLSKRMQAKLLEQARDTPSGKETESNVAQRLLYKLLLPDCPGVS